MYDFHPFLTSFPITLISICLVLELVSLFYAKKLLRQVAQVNLIIGTIFLYIAFWSGYFAAGNSDAALKDLIAEHHSYGRLLLFLVTPCLLFNLLKDTAKHYQKFINFAYYLLLLVSFVLILYTGYLGASLLIKIILRASWRRRWYRSP